MSGAVRSFALVVLGLMSAIPRAAAQSDVFVQARASARVEFLKGLLDLAKWCDSTQLYAERDRLYTNVLAIEPDNADARKVLGHKRGPGGAWQVPPPREVKNRNPKALLELPAKRELVIAPYFDTLLGLVDGPNGDASRREDVYEEILAVDADEPRVRALLGDVKVADKWLMKETATGKEQREKIKAQVKASLDEVPKGVSSHATEEQAKLVGSWASVLATDAVRVLSTGDEQECQRMVQVVQVAGDLLEKLFGASIAFPPQYTIYLIARPEEKPAFIERLPNVPADQRKFMLTSVGGGIPGTDSIAVWDPDPKIRFDLAVRCTYGPLLRSAYRLSAANGFASEGLGLYLTREILGTRLTWWTVPAPAPRSEFFGSSAVTQDLEAQAMRARLMQAETNWFNEALKLFDAGTIPHLDDLTKRHIDSMDVADLLVSYALVAYMIEGRPEHVDEFFTMVGTGEGAEAAAKKTLGLTLPQLEKRVHRWLKERR